MLVCLSLLTLFLSLSLSFFPRCGCAAVPCRAVQDIFRKYPNRYESIISALCENLDTLDEPEAKVCTPSPQNHPPPTFSALCLFCFFLVSSRRGYCTDTRRRLRDEMEGDYLVGAQMALLAK